MANRRLVFPITSAKECVDAQGIIRNHQGDVPDEEHVYSRIKIKDETDNNKEKWCFVPRCNLCCENAGNCSTIKAQACGHRFCGQCRDDYRIRENYCAVCSARQEETVSFRVMANVGYVVY